MSKLPNFEVCACAHARVRFILPPMPHVSAIHKFPKRFLDNSKPEQRKIKALADRAIKLNARIGAVTTFGEDIPQACIAIIALYTLGEGSASIYFNLLLSVITSLRVTCAVGS